MASFDGLVIAVGGEKKYTKKLYKAIDKTDSF